MGAPFDRRSFVAGLGASVVACGLGAGMAFAARRASGRVAARVWTVDRDGHALHLLDDGLLIVRTVALERPVRVAVGRDGAPWVARAPLGPDASHVLERRSAEGAVLLAVSCGPLLELAAAPQGGVRLLAREADGAVRLEHVDARGARTRQPAPPGARCVAASATSPHVAVAGRAGLAFVLAGSTASVPHREGTVGAEPVALAPAPRGDGWWWLERGPRGRLLRVGGDLAVRAVASDPLERATHLAADPTADRCWSIDAAGGQIACHEAGGRRVGIGEVQGTDGLGRAAAHAGRVLVAAAGALVAFDASCRAVASQGGFEWLADVAVRPP